MERIRSIFNKAIDWGWEGVNPAVGIKKFKEKSHDRFLQPDELPRFFRALSNESNEAARDFFMISLLAGARKSNTLAKRWSDINFTAETWRIEDTKNAEALAVQLPKEAMEILTERKWNTEPPWVFEGNGAPRHLADSKNAWMRVLKEAVIDNLRIHDLRLTLGCHQAATGGQRLYHRQTPWT